MWTHIIQICSRREEGAALSLCDCRSWAGCWVLWPLVQKWMISPKSSTAELSSPHARVYDSLASCCFKHMGFSTDHGPIVHPEAMQYQLENQVRCKNKNPWKIPNPQSPNTLCLLCVSSCWTVWLHRISGSHAIPLLSLMCDQWHLFSPNTHALPVLRGWQWLQPHLVLSHPTSGDVQTDFPLLPLVYMTPQSAPMFHLPLLLRWA